jgi:hypothetical protein
MTNAANVAAAMTSSDIFRVSRAIESELLAAMAAGVRGTQAHVGQLELLRACTEELDRRGIVPSTGMARDGLDLPVLHDTEDGVKYSVAVLVF